MSKQDFPNLKDHTIKKLKEARAIYINLKEQNCSKNVLQYYPHLVHGTLGEKAEFRYTPWGNECLKLRQLLEEINKK